MVGSRVAKSRAAQIQSRFPNTNSVFLFKRTTSENIVVATIKSSIEEDVVAMGIGVAGNWRTQTGYSPPPRPRP
ncbi:hypothetical protein CPC08DRAFT_468350 [Agrocybe pediades]|nr:hypothetical protein CPC08DRAFT_468350 [Agrocybe pediades]